MKKIFVSIVALATSLPASAGVVYDVQNTINGTTTTTSIAVTGSKMKMNVGSGAGDWDGDMLFDGDDRQMTIVNHDDESYMVIDEKQMRQISDQIGQAMASMEQALASMPESQRAKMEQMMKSRMPDLGTPREPSELKATGRSDSVNGLECTTYEIWRSGVKERELCVTDWDNIAGGREVAGVFREMAAFMKEMLDSLPKLGQDGAFGDETYEHLDEMNGFPIRTREFGDDGVVDVESTLLSSREAAIDPADLEPPRGYKRQDIMKGMK